MVLRGDALDLFLYSPVLSTKSLHDIVCNSGRLSLSFSFVSTSPLAESLPLLETPSTSLPMFISSGFGLARCRAGFCNTVPICSSPRALNHLCVSAVCCWHHFFLLSPSLRSA